MNKEPFKNTYFIGQRVTHTPEALSMRLDEIHKKIPKVKTPYLSPILEIIKRIHFASTNKKDQLDNVGYPRFKEYGTIFSKDDEFIYSTFEVKTSLNYTAIAGEIGVCYGTFKKDTDKETGEDIRIFCPSKNFNGYGRFIADIVTQQVAYIDELESFIHIDGQVYQKINDQNFNQLYSVKSNHQIDGFLKVFEELFDKHMNQPLHDYMIHPNDFIGNDFIYHCENFEFETDRQFHAQHLYPIYYEVDYEDIDTTIPNEFLKTITEQDNALHNLRLLHAYILFRKLEIEPPEKFFILKDFGRTGKGLFTKTFNAIYSVNAVNFDALQSGGFDGRNAWLTLKDCDVATANESGEIDRKNARILRKIATNEIVSGRSIGNDNVSFQLKCVLVLDTNESVELGNLTANKSRTVAIPFKDRPKGETDEERFIFFAPYWNYIQDENGDFKLSACLSFLIASLDYLKEQGGRFKFRHATLKEYATVDELTETQRMIISGILSNPDGLFIQANDETLQKLVAQDYGVGAFRLKSARDDLKKIGVSNNAKRWIDGVTTSVKDIQDLERFKQSAQLLIDSDKDLLPLIEKLE